MLILGCLFVVQGPCAKLRELILYVLLSTNFAVLSLKS